MKKLLFVATALAAISLLAPSSGFAQWENRIGVYTDQDPAAGSAELTVAASTPTNIYFVLTNPVNRGTPVQRVEAFEFRVDAEPLATFFKLNESFPTQGINITTYPDYVVGFAAPWPVTNNRVTLMTWQVMVLNTATHKLFLNLIPAPTIAGRIAYQDADGATGQKLVAATPSVSSGTLGDNVFAINGTLDPTAEESESWGSVKALFR
jgi:hypothetical protein